MLILVQYPWPHPLFLHYHHADWFNRSPLSLYVFWFCLLQIWQILWTWYKIILYWSLILQSPLITSHNFPPSFQRNKHIWLCQNAATKRVQKPRPRNRKSQRCQWQKPKGKSALHLSPYLTLSHHFLLYLFLTTEPKQQNGPWTHSLAKFKVKPIKHELYYIILYWS